MGGGRAQLSWREGLGAAGSSSWLLVQGEGWDVRVSMGAGAHRILVFLVYSVGEELVGMALLEKYFPYDPKRNGFGLKGLTVK